MSMNLTPHTAPKMHRAPRYRHKVATFRKNSMERIDVTLEEYNGYDLLNIAVIRDSSGQHRLNKMKGTARFVSLNTRLLPQIIAALQEAERKAVDLGILEVVNSTSGAPLESGHMSELKESSSI